MVALIRSDDIGGSWPPEAPVAPWIDLESAGIFLIVRNNSEGTQVELCI